MNFYPFAGLQKNAKEPSVTEPFIVPSLYEKYMTNDENVTVLDEWTLSLAMGEKLPEEMENHYKTFIVREPSPYP